MGGGTHSGASGLTDGPIDVASAVLPVAAGDWFEAYVYMSAAHTIKGVGTARNWFARAVVETEDAADPPADQAVFKPGQPGASEVLLRVPVARCTRFEAGIAGKGL